MDQVNPRRYVPAPPPPTSRGEAQRRLQLRLELTKPSAFTKESESSIVDLLRKTRSPFAGVSSASGEEDQLVEAEALALEKTLRAFQKELVQQERLQRERQIGLEQTEASIVKRAGELADQRRLLDKQREVFESGLRSASESFSGGTPVSQESLRAMQELQAKIEEQTKALEESKQWLAEREAFLDESESKLIEKMQAHQERETELEQRLENFEKHAAKVEELAAKLRARGEVI